MKLCILHLLFSISRLKNETVPQRYVYKNKSLIICLFEYCDLFMESCIYESLVNTELLCITDF